ncbi:MAG: OsmC family protein [Acidimicrobiales bacterium]
MTTESDSGQGIREAHDRLDAVLSRRPEFGRDTERSVSTVTGGLRCTSEEGDWRFETDLPDTLGGEGSGPSPGVLGRAALGSCLAIGYQMRAARLGVPVLSIRVEIEADYDVAGMLSPDADARPGYSEVRYHVTVESDAPEADIQRVIDEGDLLSPYLDVFSATTPMQRQVSIRPPGV